MLLFEFKTHLRSFHLKKLFKITVLILIINLVLKKYNQTDYVEIDNSNYLFYNVASNITSSKCGLSTFNEWDEKLRKLIRNPPIFGKCVKNQPFSYIINDTIYLNQAINRTIFKGELDYCEVAPVFRNVTINDNFKLGAFVRISDNSLKVREFESDFFFVRCYNHDLYLRKKRPKNSKIINNKSVGYEYVHHTIRNKFWNNQQKYSEKFNVMILIIDALSLNSAKRSLPNTVEYLKSFEEFYLFEKQHIVGENTFENLVPLLTNLDEKQAYEYIHVYNYRNDSIQVPFDDLPFIWKDFKKNGYLTYFSEDWKAGTFYNSKFGFRNSPTDHYLRPYWLSVYDSLSYPPSNTNSNPTPCYYDKLLHKLAFEWLIDFEKYYSEKNVPRFGLLKLNEMSHDQMERIAWIDDDLKQMLNDLFTDKFLNQTLFILMGDHGHRLHPIRQTFLGRLEHKLPLLGVMVPKLLVQRNPFLKFNLKENTKKLTTWFDVYETLVHLLLDQTNLSDSIYYNRRKKLNGFSLFTKLPDRDCNETKIPHYLCSCGTFIDIDLKSDLIQKAAIFTLRYINDVLLRDYKKICARLKLSEVKDAQYKNNIYTIIFKTRYPSNALFDASFVLNDIGNTTLKENEEPYFKSNKKIVLIGKIERINSYGTRSECINVYFLKSYCYCLNNIKKLRNSRHLKLV